MKLELTPQDVFRVLSPVGCLVEALAVVMLFTAMSGCLVSTLL
ncbi:MAG: hypothetical protein ABEJ82_05040 [Haloplanus sp.]